MRLKEDALTKPVHFPNAANFRRVPGTASVKDVFYEVKDVAGDAFEPFGTCFAFARFGAFRLQAVFCN